MRFFREIAALFGFGKPIFERFEVAKQRGKRALLASTLRGETRGHGDQRVERFPSDAQCEFATAYRRMLQRVAELSRRIGRLDEQIALRGIQPERDPACRRDSGESA